MLRYHLRMQILSGIGARATQVSFVRMNELGAYVSSQSPKVLRTVHESQSKLGVRTKESGNCSHVIISPALSHESRKKSQKSQDSPRK
jgi:hypothetical protein